MKENRNATKTKKKKRNLNRTKNKKKKNRNNRKIKKGKFEIRVTSFLLGSDVIQPEDLTPSVRGGGPHSTT